MPAPHWLVFIAIVGAVVPLLAKQFDVPLIAHGFPPVLRMEQAARLELATPTLEASCSTD